MMYPDDFKYSKDHEWADIEGDTVRIGITDYAQEQLGDVVFVDLPQVGETFKQNDVFGTIESVKAVSDLYCPVSGEVIQINEALDSEPEIINEDPHGDGWMIVVKLTDVNDLENLMTADEYEEMLQEEDEDYADDEDEDEEMDDDFDGDYDEGDDEDY